MLQDPAMKTLHPRALGTLVAGWCERDTFDVIRFEKLLKSGSSRENCLQYSRFLQGAFGASESSLFVLLEIFVDYTCVFLIIILKNCHLTHEYIYPSKLLKMFVFLNPYEVITSDRDFTCDWSIQSRAEKRNSYHVTTMSVFHFNKHSRH